MQTINGIQFVEATRETFLAAMGPQNVHPRAEKHASFWELPNRELIGYSTPGYMGAGPRAYYLRPAFAKVEQPQ